MMISIHGRAVLVDGAPGVNVQLVVASKKFRDWVASLDPRFIVEQITITWVYWFHRQGHEPSVGFCTFKVQATPESVPASGVIFARGHSTGILIELECEGEIFFLMTEQPRLAVGSVGFLEIAAGMLDESGDFAGTAAREIDEETGFRIRANELIALTSEPLALSPGACDERMGLFRYRVKISRADLDALRGKLTGLAAEDETITLRVLTLAEAFKIPDAKTLLALLLAGHVRPQ
jgi:ADP-sugar diphosphatase